MKNRFPTVRRVMVATAALSAAALTTLSPATGRSRATGTIAFEATVNGKPQVFTIGPDGTSLKQLTHLSAPALWGAAWVPGSSALILSASGNGPDLLYRLDLSGGAPTAVSSGCTAHCLGDDFPAATRDGSKLAFERAIGPVTGGNAAAVGIFTMSAYGSDLAQLTHTERPTSTEDHPPTWAPDATRIAFERLDTTSKPVGHGAIYVMRADGTGARRLTAFALNANAPQWSPDGTRILFNSNEPQATGQSANVYSIRPDGSDLRRLTHFVGGKQQAFAGSWSPDGKQIVFHLRGATATGSGVNQLFVMNADGTHMLQLTHLSHTANPVYPEWGP